MRRATVVMTAVLAAALAGCGGDDEPAGLTEPGPSTLPRTDAPLSTTPSGDPGGTPAPNQSPRGADGDAPTGGASPPAGGEDQPGGAGDEEAARVPAVLTISSRGELSPGTVRVPGFLAIEVTVASNDDAGHQVEIATSPPVRGRVPAGDSLVERVPGQQPGRYAIRVDGQRAATLVVGGEPGP